MIQADDSAGSRPPAPIPNSYWVEPGRLLAGEYPGSRSRAETMDRIRRLLHAGVTTFIDLTQAGELPDYAAFLRAESSIPIEHHRWPIVDHGVPPSAHYMVEILDAISAARAQDRCVYVHCRAGIGRTGTTIACYLTRSGLTADQALDQLQRLWQQCARSTAWPMVPETDEQRHFVRHWSEPGRKTSPTLVQRCEGALLGLALGDALGTSMLRGGLDRAQLAPERFSGGISLQWGADTAVTLAVASSLLERGGHDAGDQMERYAQCLRSNPAAIWSADFKRAIASWQWSRKLNAGTHDPKNSDPHSLARSLAAALYQHKDVDAAIELAAEISRTTHQSPVVLDLCRLWTALLIDALAGSTAHLLEGAAVTLVRSRRLRDELGDLLNRRWQQMDTGDAGAISVSARAVRALENAPTFAAGMAQALESSAAANAGALYGALAGAHFGIEAVPQRWLQALPEQQAMRMLAQKFST